MEHIVTNKVKLTHKALKLTTATTLSPIFNGQITENANFWVHSREVNQPASLALFHIHGR